jgi:type II secretory ATPase GspE/PulE/Tfp pilus assembly ATPase PilB-like protein
MEKLILLWQQLINADAPSWVLFEHGTCVFLAEPSDDPVQAATALLQQAGEADFVWEHPLGYLVSGASPCVGTFVELGELDPAEIGRVRREQDANSLNVIHIERRPSSVQGRLASQFEQRIVREIQPEAIVRVIDLILNQAIKEGVRQVDFQPGLPNGRVSFLVENCSRQIMSPPTHLFSLAAARLKSLAGIGESQRQGRLDVRKPGNETASFELSLSDTDFGEALTLTAV